MRVLLVPNAANEKAVASVRELATWLSAEGFDVTLTDEDAEACDLRDFGVPASQLGEPVLVVSLGGDGTILKAAHLIGEAEAPILGINLGRRGFMAGAAVESMREAVSSALAGEGRVERRAVLHATVVMEGREVGRYRALNEVYVGRATGRAVDVVLTVNDAEFPRVTCDGMVVATATGSTAYALSAGGPAVSPALDCAVIVPVAPHALSWRPIVVAPSDVVTISLPNPGRADACVLVDGHTTPCRRRIEQVVVSRGAEEVRLVKLNGRDFYEVLRDEFFGGQ